MSSRLVSPVQSHLNGSVEQDPQSGTWTASVVHTGLDDQRASLRLSARSGPELWHLEGQLRHNLRDLLLRGLPGNGRLLFTGSRTEEETREGGYNYNAEALVQVEECIVRAAGAAMSGDGHQGSLSYNNNCTVLQARAWSGL